MRPLHSIGIMVVSAPMFVASAVYAQSSQQGTQTNANGVTTPSSGSNTPYSPPTAPSTDASATGYTGKGSGGYGSGTYGSGQTGTSDIVRIGKDNPLTNGTPENQQQIEMQQARARNAERQQQLVADTQKLVLLANELEEEVNKSTKDMLSLDVVRKADEIDKLARTVRDRMKNAN